MWPLSVSPCGIETERSIGARTREREAVTPSASCFFRLAQNASRAFTAVFSSGSTLLLPRSHYDSPFSLYPSVYLSVSFCLVTFSPSHHHLSLSLFLSVCPCIRLSLALFCRSIPSRRTFKCHQPDREVGLDISLYRVCLKCLTSARVPLTGKKSCRVKIRRCYWDIYLLKRVSVLKLFVLWENLIDIFLLIWKIDANFLVLIFN